MIGKELTTIELQKIENDILRFTAGICDKNGITYYLSSGTLLGAVRHGGFIPWDDDIDLYMYREDYERFSEVMKTAKNSPYKLLYYKTDKNYSLPLPKVIDTRTVLRQLHQRETSVLGVYIDIFILDNAPDDAKERDKYIKRLSFLQRVWDAAQNKDNDTGDNIKLIIKKALRRVLWVIGPRTFSIVIDKYAQKYRKAETGFCGNLTYSNNLRKAIIQKCIYGKGKKLVFEGEPYNAPERYEEYLTHYYGDYMQLPPIDKRTSAHNFEAFMKDGI